MGRGGARWMRRGGLGGQQEEGLDMRKGGLVDNKRRG